MTRPNDRAKGVFKGLKRRERAVFIDVESGACALPNTAAAKPGRASTTLYIKSLVSNVTPSRGNYIEFYVDAGST